jgi:NAD(P)-dependent dehydrogenase (short-subunit alcohol dehydrogenase family)
MIMPKLPMQDIFTLTGQVAVITGGAGVLCASLIRALSELGVHGVILDINQDAAGHLAEDINRTGGKAWAIECDVCDKDSLNLAAGQIMDRFGRVDILINGAGGNTPRATTGSESPFFDLPENDLKWVIDLNLISTILASQVFGKIMAEQKMGVILNISSMNAFRPLTKIPAYSAAKAAVSNFTQWLAVHMAQEYSSAIRVNAIAPGFFLTDQNRYLLIDQHSGNLTERGQKILEHTPMRRFGAPEDLLGTVVWLISPASTFVSGIVVPVDGGFSAFSGV